MFRCCQWYSCAGRSRGTDEAPAATRVLLMRLPLPRRHRGILAAAEQVGNALPHSPARPWLPGFAVPRGVSQGCPRMPSVSFTERQEVRVEKQRDVSEPYPRPTPRGEHHRLSEKREPKRDKPLLCSFLLRPPHRTLSCGRSRAGRRHRAVPSGPRRSPGTCRPRFSQQERVAPST